MPDVKPDEVPTSPDAPIAPVESVGKPKSVITHVFAPAGGVAKSAVISAAIQSVRDAIPVVFDLDAQIVGSKKVTQDKVAGTSFEVQISYTERELAGAKKDPVNLDLVVKSLEVPQSIHDGDPNFLNEA